MAISGREAAIMVGGLVLGVAGAWALFGRGDASPDRETPSAITQPAAVAGGPASPAAAAKADPEATETAALSADLCTFDRTLPSAGGGDGKLALETDLDGKRAGGVRELLVTGKEAAASGHRRDAETAFLMACRAAGQLEGDDRILLADAMYRLGRHYAGAEPTAAAGKRAELRSRARDLYASSLQAYRARYGAEHEKTRFAASGLAALDGSDTVAVAPTAKPAKGAEADKPAASGKPAESAKPAQTAKPVEAATPAQPAKPPVAVARPPQEPPKVAQAPARPVSPPVASAPAPVPAAPPQAAQGSPDRAGPSRPLQASFDCRKARSTTEKIICADVDLARQDRELGRLHARAKEASDDPRDFQRRSDAAWSRRESTCDTRDCLQRWYAQRRAELSREAAAPASRRDAESVAAREPAVRTRPDREQRAERADAEQPRRAVVAVPRAEPAIVAPAAGDASIGQATGDAGDTSQ